MSDLTVEFTKCPHGSWVPHNAVRLNDGSVIDDPRGPCDGGWAEVNGKLYGISAMLVWHLKGWEEA